MRLSKRDLIVAGCCADWPELTKSAETAEKWIDDWFEEAKRNPVVKEVRRTEIKDVELWHGVNDDKGLQKLPNGQYLLTPRPGSDMQKLWFVPAWSHASKQIAMGYANYAMVKVMVPFEFTYVKAMKKDDSVDEHTESYKPVAPGWSRSYQVQEYYLHDGALELDPGQVKLYKEYEEEMISLNASAKLISKRADTYGYWLSPQGELIPVAFEQHMAFIRRHPEIFGEDVVKMPTYRAAFDRGWIRMTLGSVGFCFIDVPGFTNDVLDRLKVACKKLGLHNMEITTSSSTTIFDPTLQELEDAESFNSLPRLDILKRARRDEFYGDTKVNINPASIVKAYELEYKIAMLKALGSVKPSTLKTIERHESELAALLPGIIAAMKSVFAWWINYHKGAVGIEDPVEVIREAQKEYPEIHPSKLEREYYNYQMGQMTSHYNVFKRIEMRLQKDQWNKPPLSTILATYKLLQRGATGNVGSDMALFQTALTTAHFGGPFLNHFAEITGVSQGLLNDLTSGKFTDKWDGEISKYSSLNMSRRAAVYGYWLSPQGKLYPVNHEKHREYVLENPKLFDRPESSAADPYDSALSAGWTRVVCDDGMLSFEAPTFENKYLSLIQRALTKLPKVDTIMVDVKNQGFIYVEYWDFVEAKSFERLQHENQMHGVGMSSYSSVALAMNYGWWLSPEGKLHSIGTMQHKEFVMRHPEFFADYMYPDRSAYDRAFAKKWIRIAHQQGMLFIEMPSFADEYLHRVQKAELPKVERVIISSRATNDFVKASYWDLMDTSNIQKLINLEKTAISKRAYHSSPQDAASPYQVQMAKDPLETYQEKRDFDKTPEPEGKVDKGDNKHRFVIQDHRADKAGQHFDLRLENDEGTMTSFAIPKARLPHGKERLLAMKTEDHPCSYSEFFGAIKEGYGKGKVKIVSKSKTYEPVEWTKNTIKFTIPEGSFTLRHIEGNKWIIMVSAKD